ncbi:MAG TPA: ABC transporter permease [Pseudonocardiaceae bacterium]|nr:ABC transporter permease [Pseudonocardiaceae bacterium]
MSGTAGASILAQLGARRDRVILPSWCYVLIALAVGTAYTFKGLYPTVQSRLDFARTITANPTLQALTGPTFDLTTIGGLTAWRIGGLGGALLGVMNILVVVRHSRAEEEAGRLELVGAGVVGRYAPLTASLLLAMGTDLVIGLVIGGGLSLVGLPVGDSFVLGMALAVVGAAYAGIAAVAAQLTETSRGANGIALAVLGATFLLRAIGDSAGPGVRWLSWLSPIGWGQRIRPFAGDEWWVFALPLGCAVLACWVAFTLVARRDLGAGLLPGRPGPATAAAGLRSALALAIRLQRGVLLGWLVAFVVVGGVFGAVAQDMINIVATSPQLGKIIGQLGGTKALGDAFLAAVLGLLGLLSSIYTVQAVLRMRGEETAQRAEPVLATGVSRVSFAAAHVAVAAVGGALLLVASGVVTGVAYGLRSGDVGGAVASVLGGAAVQVPAAWVLAGVAVALFGLRPVLTGVAWAAVVVCFLIGELGPSLRLPQWAMDISPFTHVPRLPGGTLTGAPIGWLLGVAVVLVAVGLAGFRRRDIG